MDDIRFEDEIGWEESFLRSSGRIQANISVVVLVDGLVHTLK